MCILKNKVPNKTADLTLHYAKKAYFIISINNIFIQHQFWNVNKNHPVYQFLNGSETRLFSLELNIIATLNPLLLFYLQLLNDSVHT